MLMWNCAGFINRNIELTFAVGTSCWCTFLVTVQRVTVPNLRQAVFSPDMHWHALLCGIAYKVDMQESC